MPRPPPADAALLRHWDNDPHVVASDPNDDWNWETELARSPEWREQLIAEVDGRPVGFLQIIDPAREDSHYWGECPPGRRAIDIRIGNPSDLGRGHGTRMMQLDLRRGEAAGEVGAVVIDPPASNTRAHRFYERLGFRPVGLRRGRLPRSPARPWRRAARFRPPALRRGSLTSAVRR